MTHFRRAAEDPSVVAHVAHLLSSLRDPKRAARDALGANPNFYQEHALVIAGMVSADARDTEVQRYLRQLEQRALPVTLYATDERHAIAVAVYLAAREPGSDAS